MAPWVTVTLPLQMPLTNVPETDGEIATADVPGGKGRASPGLAVPIPGVAMIHRNIDAPVAVGISQCLEKGDVAAPREELQKGDPDGRVRIGRFHASAEQAIQEMKDKWAALQAAGMVYA